jgi:hypothetical protein
MSDAIESIAPPRDTEAGVRTRDTASVATQRDRDMEPVNPSDFDNPGYYGESRYDYAAYGDE